MVEVVEVVEGVEDHRLVHRGEHHQIVRRRALEVRRRERARSLRLLRGDSPPVDLAVGAGGLADERPVRRGRLHDSVRLEALRLARQPVVRALRRSLGRRLQLIGLLPAHLLRVFVVVVGRALRRRPRPPRVETFDLDVLRRHLRRRRRHRRRRRRRLRPLVGFRRGVAAAARVDALRSAPPRAASLAAAGVSTTPPTSSRTLVDVFRSLTPPAICAIMPPIPAAGAGAATRSDDSLAERSLTPPAICAIRSPLPPPPGRGRRALVGLHAAERALLLEVADAREQRIVAVVRRWRCCWRRGWQRRRHRRWRRRRRRRSARTEGMELWQLRDRRPVGRRAVDRERVRGVVHVSSGPVLLERRRVTGPH